MTHRKKESKDVASAVKMLKAPAQAGGSSSSSEISESASESASFHLPILDNHHPATADVHSNADKQQTKSDSMFTCHLFVLNVSMCRYYELLFVRCLSVLE